MRTIAALFVDPTGCYSGLEGVEVWDEARDARLYPGPHPIVAHPPCARWCRLAALVEARWGHKKGDDGGCFEAGLLKLRAWGGALEHPAFSAAFSHFGIPSPVGIGWQRTLDGEWVCEVWQSAYGHRARKRTWLLYHGGAGVPPELNWSRRAGVAQVGWFDRIKPTLSKSEAMATPPEFRDTLIRMARTVELQGHRERSATPPAFRDELLKLARSAR